MESKTPTARICISDSSNLSSVNRSHRIRTWFKTACSFSLSDFPLDIGRGVPASGRGCAVLSKTLEVGERVGVSLTRGTGRFPGVFTAGRLWLPRDDERDRRLRGGG